jgi:NAD(P)H-nitrite reductase large subunit
MVARADDLRDRDLASAGCGGSIPLVESLKTASPDAEVILSGTSDVAGARIHASDESVDPRRSNG